MQVFSTVDTGTKHTTKSLIGLVECPGRSESSLGAHVILLVVNDPNFLQADSEDSDQTGRMPRLI